MNSALPADLDRIIHDLAANEAAVLKVSDGLAEDELNRQPAGGRAWGILQCVEHVTMTNRVYTGAMQSVIASGGTAFPPRSGPLQPSLPGRLFLKRPEPPVRGKAPAPRAIRPAAHLSKAEVLGTFQRSHDAIREIVLAVRDLDLNRLRFRNPLLPALRVRFGTALLIMAAHERRHLWQARNVRTGLSGSTAK